MLFILKIFTLQKLCNSQKLNILDLEKKIVTTDSKSIIY